MFHGPAEISVEILSRCDFDDLKNASLVSRQLRRLSSLLLFRTVSIHLGVWEIEEDRGETLKEINEAKVEANANRSLDILVGLAGNPMLAGVVRRLTIFTFTKSFLVFELYHVGLLLSKLTNLECFQWLGGSPAFSSRVAEALTQYCPSLLSASVIGLDDSTATTLCNLHHLRALELVDPNEHTGEWDPPTDLSPQILQTLLNTHSNTLASLSLPGALASSVNILRSAHTLTHLFISRAGTCKGLDLFLQHADALRSLIVTDCDTLSFLPVGRGSSSDVNLNDASLPALRDLKLIISLPTSLNARTRGRRDFFAESQTLLKFTSLHPDLDRFDFSLEPSLYFERGGSNMYTYDNDKWFPNVVKAICKLKAAKALGFSFPSLSPLVLEKALNDIYENGISWYCTSLRISGLAEMSCSQITYELLPYITGLKFLWLSNHRPLENHRYVVPLPTLNDLWQIRSLELACLNSDVHDIRNIRRRAGKTEPWSREKIRFRSPSDFPNDDAYWLMSHRLITTKYDLGERVDFDF
ncbi:hypothetical protein SCHPADRAFT_942520 [Schizopora paradoxa]|uniref:F-box domain-containing protein n=1 Tax=Schizopora paradoxa TaxID=27342 RepID=A0A0H2RH16_9AGAM|nr:hypothetical protein SCHPADRAFT_942520 [Schizopora paradoxa]